MRGLKDISSERLLLELMHRHGTDKAPVFKHMIDPHQCCVVGIGDGHKAELLIDNASMKALLNRIEPA